MIKSSEVMWMERFLRRIRVEWHRHDALKFFVVGLVVVLLTLILVVRYEISELEERQYPTPPTAASR